MTLTGMMARANGSERNMAGRNGEDGIVDDRTTKDRVRPLSLSWVLIMALMSSVLASQAAKAQTYTVLYNFTGSSYISPNEELIADAAGNLYGTATINFGSTGLGTLFKLDPSGVETDLYIFANGSPLGGVYRDAAGNIFGTTENPNCGSVFRVNPSGDLRILYSFACRPDGQFPYTRIVDIKGGLFGTTPSGGASGVGTVYRVSDQGAETIFYSFTGGADGAGPNAITRDSAGNLYGTTGTANDQQTGTVFKLDTSDTFSVLYTFTGGTDGAAPRGHLIRDAQGNIHGTTYYGGQLDCVSSRDALAPGCGVVFRLDGSTGQETVLHKFFDGEGGRNPQTGVVDLGGVLYGTTTAGGDPSCDCGVLYRISATGQYSVLHRFTGGADGAYPGELTAGPDGSLYGTTASGGPHTTCVNGCGTVFKYEP